MKSVLVIGAGLGGIATAARLARMGCQVTVLEKGTKAGGRCGRLVKDGHTFDTGSTLFVLPKLYEKTFADLGEQMQDHLDLSRVDPTYHVHFADGSGLALTSDRNAMRAQLELMEPGSFDAFQEYIHEGKRNYNLALPHVVERNFRNPFEFFTLKNLFLFFQLNAHRRHYARVGRFFHDPRLRIAFTFQNLYMGTSPFEAQAVFSLLQYSELTHGIWFPKGGMYTVIEAFKAIAEALGVTFVFDTPVAAIDVEDHRAVGVTLDGGESLRADVVVANADLPYVYRELLPADGMVSRLNRLKYGCSALMFFWGVDRQYPQLGPHNLFFAEDIRASFEPIFEDFTLIDDPHFYVYAPARADPSAAPDGHDTLVVGLPVGCLNDSEPVDWDPILERMRTVVLQRLRSIGIVDLASHIKFELTCTPQDWQERLNLVKGSTHGLSHQLFQLGYLRPSNRHRRYRNLYFVGASTHPGTGLPTVLVSAQLVAERIQQEMHIT